MRATQHAPRRSARPRVGVRSPAISRHKPGAPFPAQHTPGQYLLLYLVVSVSNTGCKSHTEY